MGALRRLMPGLGRVLTRYGPVERRDLPFASADAATTPGPDDARSAAHGVAGPVCVADAVRGPGRSAGSGADPVDQHRRIVDVGAEGTVAGTQSPRNAATIRRLSPSCTVDAKSSAHMSKGITP